MATDVLITRHAADRFSARALALPAVVATGDSEAAAVAELRAALAELWQHSHIIQADLPLPEGSAEHPWMRFAGIWSDDPDWQAFEEVMAEARREQDDQASPA
jgi:predicted RNase H-like HicB family nuclease